MNSFLKGGLTGTMGASDKYGQIQDEQRKFQADQTKAQAADMRKRRFAEFNYELKDSYSGSGQMKGGGAELSKRELEEQPKGAALESKAGYTERMRVEAEQRQLDKTIAAEGRSEERQIKGEKRRAGLVEESAMGKLGDSVDPKTGKRLTGKEEVDYNDSGKETMSRFDYQQKLRAELNSTAKKETAITKAMTSSDLETDYAKNDMISNIVASAGEGSEEYKKLMSNKATRDAVVAHVMTEDILVMQSKGSSKDQIVSAMMKEKPRSLSREAFQKIVEKSYKIALESGEMVDAFGPAWLTGTKGGGQ